MSDRSRSATALAAAASPAAPAWAQLLVGGSTIAGTLLSSSGKTLYVTSEVTWPTSAAAGRANAILTHGGCVGRAGSTPNANGVLTVIDLASLTITG